jgi:2-hydroxychromene-2-carboxylate isomerase
MAVRPASARGDRCAGSHAAAVQDEPLKLYFDYKSPFAYLAKDPAFELPIGYRVDVRWIPFLLRIKGKGERSSYSEYKAQYSYMDARRWANRRGGFPIKGPLKVYNSEPALIGGLYAMHHGFFRAYTDVVYARFFQRELEIDVPDEIAKVVGGLGGSGSDYLAYMNDEGAAAFRAAMDEAAADRIFGVPTFVLRGELFWGHDRMPLLAERLGALGLQR